MPCFLRCSGAVHRSETEEGERDRSRCGDRNPASNATHRCFTFPGVEEAIAAKVCDLHHHAIVHHTVSGLEAPVHLEVTGVEVGHALKHTAGFRWSSKSFVS